MKIDGGVTALVTGGASGLGAAVAVKLSKLGARVAILDTDNVRGRAMAKDVGGLFVSCDVGDPQSVASALATFRADLGQERVCVNCAGIAVAQTTLQNTGPHDAALFEKVLRINLSGTFNVASQSAAGMAQADPVNADGERGIIINTASIAAFDGQIGHVAYSASKSGIVGMTLPMARDLARHGIRVVAIAPGMFDTAMAADLPGHLKQSVLDNIPFHHGLVIPRSSRHWCASASKIRC